MIYLVLLCITTYTHALSTTVGEPFTIDIPNQPHIEQHLRTIQTTQPLGYCLVLDSFEYQPPLWHCTCRMTKPGSFTIQLSNTNILVPTVHISSIAATIPPLTLISPTRQTPTQASSIYIPYRPFWPLLILLLCIYIGCTYKKKPHYAPIQELISWSDCLAALNTIAHTQKDAHYLHDFFLAENNRQLARAALYIDNYSYCSHESSEFLEKTKAILLRYLPYTLEKLRQ